MSLLLSGPRLIHWDCQALCLGPRLGRIDEADVVFVVDEASPVDGLPPLAISLMRSNGFLASPLDFEPPPSPPNDPILPSPDALDKLPLPERDGIDAVEELKELLSIDSVPELESPANPANPNLDNASGETFDPANNGCRNGIDPAAAAQGKPANDCASNFGNFPPLPRPAAHRI